MTQQTKLRVNLDGLEEMKRQIGNTYRTRVGVIGSDASRSDGDGINNAELLMIHMFGSLTRNIPARDPLYEPIIKHRRELIKKMGSGAIRAAFDRQDYKRVFELLGVAAEEIVQNAFATSGDGTWPPNLPSTVARKGSSKPLIDTGELRKSITSDVVKKGGEAIHVNHQAGA